MQDDIRPDVAVTDESQSDSTINVDSVIEEREQLGQKLAALQDRNLRLQAEFDNFRRRSERDRQEFAEYAGMETVRALLPILDDFERALKVASESSSTGIEFVKGVELIYNRFLDTLKKVGVEPIASEGAQFDPHLHHAVQKEQTDVAEDGTILDEYQRGYNFRGKLLRPAMVKVAVKA